ncbi:hypothetical protein BLNAU_3172 [Blattamonas nauphoetae]|uniref:Uncharacterized protein n=1 Tax=Blattamonas nauphoetae TaxID=2049346 RepID=A0ABQ9YD90_9EUKA|nr:hypothetical protein BLNAU_3172 [Blattamonas nauphoetae]
MSAVSKDDGGGNLGFLNHMTKGQRNDLLLRFGAALSQRDVKDIDFKSLSTIVSSDEDVITLFHTDPAESDHTFSTRPTRPTFRNLPPALLDVLCNELMACVILGIGDEVYETIVTNFTTFSESISREQTERHWQKLEYSCFQKIVEISQNCIDPVERIASFINNLPNKTMPVYEYGELYPMNLLSQCLRHSATFLNVHPDLIDSFHRTVDLSSSPSYTPFRHDRHLSLLSALSQSSSSLFAKLCESLLVSQFDLLSLLSPRSFIDPGSAFFHLASTNPAFFGRIVEKHTRCVLDLAVSTAVMTVRVVSDSPHEPHCLDFGRGTQNWVVLLKAMADLRMDLAQPSTQLNVLLSPLLTLLILSAASTNDELSAVAVSVFSNKFGLSTKQTETLLLATPSTFPVNPSFSLLPHQGFGATDHQKDPCQSICADAGQVEEGTSRVDERARGEEGEQIELGDEE